MQKATVLNRLSSISNVYATNARGAIYIFIFGLRLIGDRGKQRHNETEG